MKAEGLSSSKSILDDDFGQPLARTAFYRIMRVCERFPDLDRVVSFYDSFMKLDPETRLNFLAYESIRESEETLLAALKGM